MNKDLQQRHFYLAVDVGTQSIRVGIVDNHGEIFDLERLAIEPYFSIHPGWAEQHAPYYWEMLCRATASLFRRQKEMKSKLCAMSVTTQRSTMINLDRTGRPLRPAILWLDDRKAQMRKLFPAPVEWMLKPLGVYSLLRHTYRNTDWNWLRQHQPEVVENTHKYLGLSGYLHCKISGHYHESVSSVVGYLPFDYKNHRWMGPRHPLRRLFDVPLEKLPQLFQTGQVIGQVSSQASHESGLPDGLPLIAGAADKAAEVLGSGVVDDGDIACLSLGTTATVQAVTRQYREVERFSPLYPSAVAGLYNSEVMIYKGFWMVSWFRDEFGHLEKMQSKENRKSPEMLLDQFLSQVPPGSMGLITQPYWGAGVRYPSPSAKGVIMGFGDVHTRPYVYRSIIEGLGYALKQGLLQTESRLKRQFRVLRIAGGGSQSDNIMQIMADITDRPVERPHTYEASILGTAVNMAVALGHYPSYAAAVAGMVRVKDRFEPDGTYALLYQKIYDQIYTKLYDQLSPLYDRLQSIVGYPAE